ncbi:MAG: hypothetical protein ACD_20C00084G0012 [uncultured bacterium]|nr:MAG: hypothetical protein ACD_20C00084G0012 [uncultured bacterium]HBH18411.1 hypothetical protein [Cyanobacteria bacterium UBA9579]
MQISHKIPVKQNNGPKFKGNIACALTKQLATEPWYVKSAVKFSEVGGEKLSITVNSLGKFAIAPLVIAFNPFSSEEKDNRAYSAWKQPIEAVLTFVTQIGLVAKTSQIIDKLAKTGQLGSNFNISKNQTKQALKMAEKRLDVLKDRVSLGLTLASLPFIISAVNWIYPKFMAKFFPNLSKTKIKD